MASQFGVNREAQDKLAVRSHARAAAATKAGKFKDEIVPMKAQWKVPKSGEEKEVGFPYRALARVLDLFCVGVLSQCRGP